MSSVGQLLEIEVQLRSQQKLQETANQSIETNDKLTMLLKSLEQAETAEQKGRLLEDLVVGLMEMVPGFDVESKRLRTETEEIDIVVVNQSEEPRLRREETYILVECKNWSSKCGKNEYVIFKDKLQNRKGRSSLGFFVSWSGFSETVTKEMLRNSHERLLIVPISGEQIRLAVGRGDFLTIILAAMDESVHT